jgi:hypothetical protein
VRSADLAQVELDPGGVEVEGDGVGREVLGEDTLELVERNVSTAIRVEELEGNLEGAGRC